MKNKFWFSEGQWDPCHRTWVLNPATQEWVEYTEWTTDDQKPGNWEDTHVVFETDDDHPRIRVESDDPFEGIYYEEDFA